MWSVQEQTQHAVRRLNEAERENEGRRGKEEQLLEKKT